MKAVFMKIKEKFSKPYDDDDEDFDMPDVVEEEGYVELSTLPKNDSDSSLQVRPFSVEEFTDIKPIIELLREGHTIALVNIRPLRDKDLVELKRAINKLKKTCDAIGGDIAGFSEDWLVVAPSFVSIYRDKRSFGSPSAKQASDADDFDDDF